MAECSFRKFYDKENDGRDLEFGWHNSNMKKIVFGKQWQNHSNAESGEFI